MKPYKKHEIFDESGAIMLVEWNWFNYKGLTFSIEPNNIYLIIFAEITVHERSGIITKLCNNKTIIFSRIWKLYSSSKRHDQTIKFKYNKRFIYLKIFEQQIHFNCIKNQKIFKI